MSYKEFTNSNGGCNGRQFAGMVSWHLNRIIKNLIIVIALVASGCAVTGPKLTETDVALGQKFLNRATSDYYFDAMTNIYSVGNKVLENLPDDKARGAYAFVPFLVMDLNFELHRLYKTNSPKGVIVIGLLAGFDAKTLDITRGDEVLALNGKQVKKEKDIISILKKIKGVKSIRVRFRRGAKEWEIDAPVHYLRRKLPFVLNGSVQDIAAYTDSKGFIYVTPALLDFADNEDELAFILARQIAYVSEGHIPFTNDVFRSRHNVKQSSLFNYYFEGKLIDGWLVLEAMGNFHIGFYPEAEERSTDKAALEYLALAQFNGATAIRFFEKLAIEKSQKNRPTYAIKIPSTERLILMSRLVDSGDRSVGDEINNEEKQALKSHISKSSLDTFLDKMLQVTGIGYRILAAIPHENESSESILPLLYLDIKPEYQKFYNVSSSDGIMVAGQLNRLHQESLGDIQRGDEIIALNKSSITSERDIDRILKVLKENQEVTLRMRRGQREWDVQVPVYSISRKVSFSIMKDDRHVNAFANAFGGITVTTAMTRFVENDDQLAFVLGHEIAHLMQKHIAKNVVNQIAGTITGVTLGSLVEAYAPGFGGFAGNVSSMVVASPYTKELEKEADYNGLLYLKAAGYAPEKAYGVWAKFAAAIPGSHDRSIIASHPSSPERFLKMKKAVEEITGVKLEDELTSRHDPEGNLGPIYSSPTSPKKVGIIESGLAENVHNLVLGTRIKKRGSKFKHGIDKIHWYAKFDATGSTKNYFSRKYRIEWYGPDGALFYQDQFKASYLNEAIAKATLVLDQPLDTKHIGVWRVQVFKKKLLIDDRTFQIVA